MSKPSDILNEKWVEVPEERPEPTAQPTSATAKERVTTELKELVEKLDKLSAYMDTDHCMSLTAEHQTLLSLQYRVMYTYAHILTRRIDIWKD